ncbi:MAG TPA: hypothetical protein VJP78_00625 [Thermoleophilia bacterium]|nr:hypothetical protein [Thermoleophilia bacterium]
MVVVVEVGRVVLVLVPGLVVVVMRNVVLVPNNVVVLEGMGEIVVELEAGGNACGMKGSLLLKVERASAPDPGELRPMSLSDGVVEVGCVVTGNVVGVSAFPPKAHAANTTANPRTNRAYTVTD